MTTSTDRRIGTDSAKGIKAPCKVATSANITLSGLQTIDSVLLVAGDRVLVRSQTDAKNNGIYIADTGTWERAADFDSSRDIATGTLIKIASGSIYSGGVFELATVEPITIGSSNITFNLDIDFVTVSPFWETVLDDTTSNAALTTLTMTRSETGAVAAPLLGLFKHRGDVLHFVPPSLWDAIIAKSDTTDLSAYWQDAINAMARFIVPDGRYYIDGGLTIDKDLIIDGYGKPQIYARMATDVFTLGAVGHLSDNNAGYYRADLKNLYIYDVNGTALSLINNLGLRTMTLENIHTLGGLHSLTTEESWAGSSVNRCRFQSARDNGIDFKQENNFFKFRSTAITGATGVGISMSAATTNCKVVSFDVVDIEGCTGGGIDVTGNVGTINMNNLFMENNSTFNIRIGNDAGDQNKYGYTLSHSYLSGAGVDILIGTSSAVGAVELWGFEVGPGNEFVDSDLIVIGGVKVFNFSEHDNRYGATSTKTIPQSIISATGLGPSELMLRYQTTPEAPYGTLASGFQGDLRYESSRGWIKNSSGWVQFQLSQVADATTCITLPTGATPSVTGLLTCTTNNVGATNVTSFTNGYPSQELLIIGLDAGNTTLVNGANLVLAGGVNFNLGDNDTIRLVCVNATKWVEISRSNN